MICEMIARYVNGSDVAMISLKTLAMYIICSLAEVLGTFLPV